MLTCDAPRASRESASPIQPRLVASREATRARRAEGGSAGAATTAPGKPATGRQAAEAAARRTAEGAWRRARARRRGGPGRRHRRRPVDATPRPGCHPARTPSSSSRRRQRTAARWAWPIDAPAADALVSIVVVHVVPHADTAAAHHAAGMRVSGRCASSTRARGGRRTGGSGGLLQHGHVRLRKRLAAAEGLVWRPRATTARRRGPGDSYPNPNPSPDPNPDPDPSPNPSPEPPTLTLA